MAQSHLMQRAPARRWISAVGVLAGLLALSACASGDKQDVVAGTEHVCSSCHGMEGKSVS